MRALTCGVLSILFTSAAFAAIQTKPIEYKAGDANCEACSRGTIRSKKSALA